DRQRLLFPADPEIAKRTLGLRAPVAVGGDFDRAERVGFGSGLRHHGSSGFFRGSFMLSASPGPAAYGVDGAIPLSKPHQKSRPVVPGGKKPCQSNRPAWLSSWLLPGSAPVGVLDIFLDVAIALLDFSGDLAGLALDLHLLIA